MSSYAPRILLFPIAEKHIAINKAQCQWHGLCSNLLRTIDKGLFVYAILYLRDRDIDYFPEFAFIDAVAIKCAVCYTVTLYNHAGGRQCSTHMINGLR